MANLIRSAKSASQWKLNDLHSYHISLNQVNPLQFFGLRELPHPSVDQDLLHSLDADTAQQDANKELLGLLDFAMEPSNYEAAVDDFAVALLRATGYVNGIRLAPTQVDLPLLICGETRRAPTDVCLVNHPQGNILLVQENKGLKQLDRVDAPAQLVAGAVAAFNRNNAGRKMSRLPTVEQEVIPGITMVGTSPTFFKIPITQTLSNHIRDGTYPPEETAVTYCYPPVPCPGIRSDEGMGSLDSRLGILRCYEAFKAVVGI